MAVSRKRMPQKENSTKMTFAVPVSFFESISIIFGGAGLIFEGLTNRGGLSDVNYFFSSATIKIPAFLYCMSPSI